MRLRTFLPILVLTALALPGGVRAQDDDYDKLQQAYEKAQSDWFQKLPKGDDGEIRFDPDKAPPHPSVEFRQKFRALAEKNLGKPGGLNALIWLVSNPDQSAVMEKKENDASWAMDHLLKHHAADPAIADKLPFLRYAAWGAGYERTLKLFEAVAKDNPSAEAKAAGKFGAALLLHQGPPEMTTEPGAEPAPDPKRDAERKRAADMMREVAKEFAGKPIGEEAAGHVFEIDHLQVGMTAPDFKGKDADGKEIALSQFKGNVVVLDFWGFW